MTTPKNFKQITERIRFGTNNTYKCTCGHSVIIIPIKDKKLCRWCGKWVFRSKRDEFKYRLEEMMKNVDKNW